MAPITAAIVTIARYTTDPDRTAVGINSLLAGLAGGFIMFLVLYAVYRLLGFNEAKHASVDTYNELCVRMHVAASIAQRTDRGEEPLREAALDARACILEYGKAFNYARNKKGLHWVLGKGFLDLARIVHRAEEALLMCEPPDLLIDEALRDQSRLTGSTIAQRDVLLNRIRRALIEVSPNTAGYLSELPPPTHQVSGASSAKTADGLTHTGNQSTRAPSVPLSDALLARTILRDTRFTINDFRDTAKARLVDARNELLARMFLTGLATAVLLVFIIIGHPPSDALLSGAILYAVGATVGLFSRLYVDLGKEGFANDYGISYVRLFQTFMVSGLAAVAGVYIAVALPITLNNSFLQQNNAKMVNIPPLIKVYSITGFPYCILLAAIFGLTPGLLISRLSQGVEQYTHDLRSSERTSQSG
jgi:hypothetical protein